MSIYFSGTFTRSAGLYSAIGKQLKLVNLKPVKKVVYKFDPFQPNVKSIRDCMFILSSEKIQSTNPQCVFKTDIVDNCEPTLAVTLEQGKEIIIKTENLNSFEVLLAYNKIVVPLIPKEEEVTGKIAGKLAGGAAGGKKGAAVGKQQAGKKK